jgi:hypothetical protein
METDMKSAQLEKVRAEIRKLSAESDKLMMETRWFPMVIVTGLFAAVATVLKFIS